MHEIYSWKRNLTLIGFATFLLFCSFTMFLQILPLHVKSLGISDSLIGFINAVFTLSSILIRPFSGKFMDKFGRFVVYYIALGLFLAMTVSYIFLSSIFMILLVRFIHGFGWGAANTASNTIATDIIPKEHLGKGIGFFSLSAGFAMMVSPYLAIEIYAKFGFETVVWLSALLVILAILCSVLVRTQKLSKTQTPSALIEQTAIKPAILIFCATMIHGAVVSFAVIYASELGLKQIGLFFTISAISLIFTRPIVGKIIDDRGFYGVVIVGLFSLVFSMVTIANTLNLTTFLLAGFFYAVGFGCLHTALQTMAVKNCATEHIGVANATFFIGFDGGIFVGSIVAGFLASAFGYKVMYLCMAAWLVLILCFIFSQKTKFKELFKG